MERLGAFDLDDLTSGIMTAIAADVVGKSFLSTIGASDQCARGEGMVCPATVAASS